jgi:hypothetical protein
MAPGVVHCVWTLVADGGLHEPLAEKRRPCLRQRKPRCGIDMRQNALATLVEWDNDVPPFPIFIGAVAHSKASRPSPMPRRQPHLFV